jgi:hypothetical protein
MMEEIYGDFNVSRSLCPFPKSEYAVKRERLSATLSTRNYG